MKNEILAQAVLAIVLFFVAFVIAMLNIPSFRTKAHAAYVMLVKICMYISGGMAMLFGVVMALMMFLIEDDL